MEIVNQILGNESARAKFSIIYNETKYPPMECLIKFLFIQFGTKSLSGYLFMPDYTATTDGKSTITFIHNKDKNLKITLVALFEKDSEVWFQYANSSITALNNFLDIISGYDLAYEQNLGIEKHDYILKLTSDYVFTIVDSGKCIINYSISSRTTVTLSRFSEEPRIGLYDFNPSKITWMTIPDLDGIFHWTLLLKCCVLIATKKEDEQFQSLEIQEVPIEETKTPPPTESTEPTQNNSQTSPENTTKTDNPPNNEENNSSATNNQSKKLTIQIDSQHESNTGDNTSPQLLTFPKHVHQTARRDSLSRDTHELSSPRNRRLSCDVNALNKFSLKVKKQMDELMSKKNSYRKTINIPEPIPEPQIEPPVIVNYSRINSQNKSYVVVEKKTSKKMTNEELMDIIKPRIEHPLINFDRYIPNYVFYNFQMPYVDFVPEDNYKENFKSLFFRSIGIKAKPNEIPEIPETFLQRDPKMTFFLLCSMVANGYRGKSIADFYKVPRQSSMMYDILSILRKYKNNIFDFMLSINEEDLKAEYAPWSIIRRDRSFIAILNEKFVKIQNDDSTPVSGDSISSLIKFEPAFPMPESVPFQFAFRPFEFIQKFLFDVFYFQRISSINPRIFVLQLAKMIYSLFSHYLVFEPDETTLSSSDQLLNLNSNSPSSSSSYFITNPITVSSIITSTVSISVFVKEVISKVKPLKKTFPPWSYLTFQQDFQESWIYFWASSFQEDKLAENFSEFFKYPELLKKYYYPCSSMRNCQWINYITEILNAISQINLSKDFEITALPLPTPAAQNAPTTTATAAISNAISDNKIIKNIAGLIGLH